MNRSEAQNIELDKVMSRIVYSFPRYFWPLLLLVVLGQNLTWAQCVDMRDPRNGNQPTRTPVRNFRCLPVGTLPTTTFTINFVGNVSNFTVIWGDGTTTTYPGPQNSVSYTYITAGTFTYRIIQTGCTDTIVGQYVNDYNTSVPGIGFVTPPAGFANKRCVPEDLSIINLSPGMRGFDQFVINWGDNTFQTIDDQSYFQTLTHTYQPGTTGCQLMIRINYRNLCNAIPGGGAGPFASYGEYFFMDIDSAAVSPTDILLCAPTDVTIRDITKLNCLDSLNRQLKWTREFGFANPLPFPGDNVFRPYNPVNRTLNIPAAALIPVPADSLYRLKMVIRNQCGDDSAYANIRIVSPRTPVFNVLNDNTCPGEPMNFRNNTPNPNGAQTYRWNFGDGTIVNNNSPDVSHTYIRSGTYRVILSAIINGYNGQICLKTDSITVRVKDAVSPIFQVIPKVGCDSLTITVKNKSLNTVGATWRGWELGGTPVVTAGSNYIPTIPGSNPSVAEVINVNPADSTALIKYKQHGKYAIKLRAVSLGCPEVAYTDSITIYPSPIIRWRANPIRVCLGQSITVRDSSRIMSTNSRGLGSDFNHINWTLNMGDGTIYQSANPITNNFNNPGITNRITTHNYIVPGNYTIRLTVRGPLGQDVTAPGDLITPLPSTGGGSPIGEGVTMAIDNDASTKYLNTAGANSGMQIVPARGATVVTGISLTSANDSPVRDPRTYLFRGSNDGVTWSTISSGNVPNFTARFQKVTVIFSNTVAYTHYRLTFPALNGGSNFQIAEVELHESGNQCPKTDTIAVTVQPNVLPTFTVRRDICDPATFRIMNTSSVASAKFEFIIRRGVNPYTTITRTVRDTFSVTLPYIPPADSTSYSIVLRVVSGTAPDTCVSSTAPLIVRVPATLAAAFSPSFSEGCTPLNGITFIDNSFNVPQNGLYVYNWNFGNGNTFVGENPPAQNYVNNTTLFKRDTVRLRIIGPGGCVWTAQRVITIFPNPSVGITAPIDNCNGNIITFNATGNGLGAFNWSFAELDGTTSNLQNPVRTVSNLTGFVRSARIRLSATSVAGCTDTASININIHPNPIAAFTSSIDAVCGNDLTPIVFNATTSVRANLYTWQFNDGAPGIIDTNTAFANRTFPQNYTSLNRTYNVQLRVASQFGCLSQPVSRTITIRPSVRANFIQNIDRGCHPLTVNFQNLSTQTDDNYTWYVKELGTTGLGLPGAPNQPGYGFRFTFGNLSNDTVTRYLVTLVARDDNGSPICEDSYSDTIFVYPQPFAAFTTVPVSPITQCSPTIATLAPVGSLGTTTYLWKYDDGSPNFSTTNTSPFTKSFTNPGSNNRDFIVTLIAGNSFGCTDTTTRNVTVKPSVVAAFSISDSVGCSPVNVRFTNNSNNAASNFTWYINGQPFFFNRILPDQAFVSTSSSDTTFYTISLVARGLDGVCTDSSVGRIIKVLPKPVVDLVAQPNSGCAPLNVSLNANGSQGGNVFSWYVRAAADTTFTLFNTTNNPEPIGRIFTNQGQYFAKLVVEGGIGCRDSVTVPIQVSVPVQPVFAATDTTGCSPLLVRFTNLTPATPGVIYSWKVDGVVQPVGNPALFEYTFAAPQGGSAVTYTVTLTATTPAGCSADFSRTIRVNPLPDFNFTSSLNPASGCSPVVTTFSVQNPAGVSQYKWKFGTTDSLTRTSNADFTRNFANNGSNLLVVPVTVTGTSAQSCSVTRIGSFVVNPAIQAGFIQSPDSGCSPLDVTFTNSGSSPGVNQVNWFVNGVFRSNNLTGFSGLFGNSNPTQSAIYNISMVGSNNAAPACVDTARRTLKVFPKPRAFASAVPASGCSPLQVDLQSNLSEGGLTFRWFIKAQADPNYVFLGQTSGANFTHTFVNTGNFGITFTVRLLVLNAQGCIDSSFTSVVVNPSISAAFSLAPDSIGCAPFAVQFTNQTTSLAANVFQWSVNGVTQFTPNPAMFNYTFLNNQNNNSQVYMVTLLAANAVTGCSATVSRNVTVLPLPAVDFTTSLDPNSACSPVTVDLTPIGIVNATNLHWKIGSSDSVSADVSQVITRNFVNTSAAAQVIPVILRGTSAAGCVASMERNLTIYPLVQVNFNASRLAGCSPLTVDFTNQGSSAGADAFQWFVDGQLTSTNSNGFSQTFTNPSPVAARTYVIQMVGSHSANAQCRDTATRIIRVDPTPLARLQANPSAGCGPLTVTFNASQSQGADSLLWFSKLETATQYAQFQVTTNRFTPVERTFGNTTSGVLVYNVKVKIKGASGCVDSIVTNVTVYPEIVAQMTASATEGCGPLAVTFNNTTTSAGANSFAWFVNGIEQSNSPLFFNYNFGSTSNTQNTVYQVWFVARNAISGCPDTVRRTITVWPRPAVDFLVNLDPLSACSPVLATMNPLQVAGASSLNWRFGAGDSLVTMVDSSVRRLYVNPGVLPINYTVTLTGINGNGCSASMQRTFVINPGVQAAFSKSADSVCSPVRIDFANTSSAGANMAEWYVDGIARGTNPQNFSWTFENNGNEPRIFEIKLAVRNSNSLGCVDTAFSTITIYPKPFAGTVVAIPDNGCAPLTSMLTSTATGATRFYWDFGDGFALDTNAGQVNHTFLNNTSNTTRNYNVLSVVYNAFGCSDSTYKMVGIKPFVKADIFTEDTLGCSPYTAAFSGAASVNANTYTWNFGDGAQQSNLMNPTRRFENNGLLPVVFTVRLIADRNTVGCPDTATVNVRVLPKPRAEFLANPLVGCQPLPVRFTNQSTGADTNTWVFSGNGEVFVRRTNQAVIDTLIANQSSTTNLTVTAQLNISNSFGCTDQNSAQIIINPLVDADFALSQDSGCSPLRVTLSNMSSPGSLAAWFVDGEPASSALNSFSYVFTNNTGTIKVFEVKLVVRSAIANGCTDTIRKFVTVFPKPSAGILTATPEVACSPAVVSFFGNTINATLFNWNFGDGSILDTNAQNAVHTYENLSTSVTRTYRIRLIASTVHGCADTTFKNIAVRPSVVARIVSDDTAGCSPYQVRLAGSLSTNANVFEWDFGDGIGTASNANPTYIFSNRTGVIQTYMVKLVTRRTGVECEDTAYFPVKVYPEPTAMFAATPESGCQPLRVGLRNMSILADTSDWEVSSQGHTNYYRVAEFDTVIANLNPVNKVVRVKLTATTRFGCAASMERNVLVFPFVGADFVQTADSGCSPLRVSYINLSSPGSVASWMMNGSFISDSQGTINQTFYNNTEQTQHVRVTLEVRHNQATGCTDTMSKWVKIFPKPNAGSIQAIPEVGCSPLRTNLTMNANMGTRFYWDFRDGFALDTSNRSVSHTFIGLNPAANTTFNVMGVVYTEHGCSDTTYKQVVVSPQTTARISIFDSVGCAPLTLQFNGSGSVNANSFNWTSFPVSGASNAVNPVMTFDNNGSQPIDYQVQLIANRNGFSCPDTALKTIRVFPKPVAEFTSDVISGCAPLKVRFNNQSVLADENVWVFSSLTGVDTLATNDPLFEKTFQNPYAQPINVRVELLVRTANGCSATVVKNITVNPFVQASASALDQGCSPVVARFFNNSVNPNGRYTWNFGDGTTENNQFEPTHIFNYQGSTDTTFRIILTAISNSSVVPACVNRDTVSVRVFARPQVDFLMNPLVLRLPNKTVNFSNVTPYRDNYRFRWDFGDGTFDSTNRFALTHVYNSLEDNLVSTSMNVRLIAISPGGCADTIIRRLEIIPVPPVADFDPDTGGCAPLYVRFRNKSLYANEYEWNFGDGTTSRERDPDKTFTRPGEYSISLRVKGPGGEDLKIRERVIKVFDVPSASFSVLPRAPQSIKLPEGRLNAFVRFPEPGNTYEWNFGDGGRSNDRDPVYEYKQIGTYSISLRVTNIHGCFDADTLHSAAEVKFGNFIKISNVFIPSPEFKGGNVSADGPTNHVFYPFMEGATKIKLQIFNRWGQFLFESNELGKGWDGYFNGNIVKSDTYVYRMVVTFANGQTETKVGDVTVLR